MISALTEGLSFTPNITPGTIALILSLIINGRFFYVQQTREGLKLDNTKKLADIVTNMTELQQDQIKVAHDRIAQLQSQVDVKNRQFDENREELISVREYLLRDAAWHVQVQAEMKLLGKELPAAPILPPRQREYRDDYPNS